MLITNREQFDEMLDAIRNSKVVACDVESTGTLLRHGDVNVGISVYTDSNQKTYYYPFRHGMGKITDKKVTDYKNWVGSGRKIAYFQQVYNQEFRERALIENMPLEWMQELIDVWLIPETLVMHNAPFDLTAFRNEGFPEHPNVHDTMMLLAVLNPDWLGKDGNNPEFDMPDTGLPERGSRQLKWQARLWSLEGATQGIGSLDRNVRKLFNDIKEAGTQYPDKAVLTLAKPKITVDEDGEEHEEEDTDDAPKKNKKGENKQPQAYLWMLPPSQVALYAEDDTRLTYLLWVKVLDKLALWGKRDVELGLKYNRFMKDVAWKMETHGFRFDVNTAKEQLATWESLQEKMRLDIAEYTGGMVINPKSHKQVKEYLHAIGLTHITSTAKSILEKLDELPRMKDIVFYRKMCTLSTTVTKWFNGSAEGYIHPQTKIGAAGTGRNTSSSETVGNMQNIARMSERDYIQPKRMLYSPDPNALLFDIDYAALEMRLGAYIAEILLGEGKDLTLTNLIENDEDMHLYTMEHSGILDILLRGGTPEAYLVANGFNLKALNAEAEADGKTFDPLKYIIKKIARQKAKTANFAAMYGAGERGIVKALGCTREEAKALLYGFQTAYPAITSAINLMSKEATTIQKIHKGSSIVAQFIRYPVKGLQLARKYMYYPIQKEGKNGYYFPLDMAARGAFNSAVQGTGGLIMNNSILNIHERFGVADYTWVKGQRVYDYSKGLIIPCATVHDSYTFGLLPEYADSVIPEICKIMCDYAVRPLLDVSVDYTVKGSWGEVIAWNPAVA